MTQVDLLGKDLIAPWWPCVAPSAAAPQCLRLFIHQIGNEPPAVGQGKERPVDCRTLICKATVTMQVD